MGIVDFLKFWIRDIALVFVIVSIIEIVIPNNNMKRYIDMIIGLLIIIVIITPFIKLLHRDFSIDKEIFKKEIEESKFVYKDNMNLSSTQEEQIKEVYLSKIKEEIKDLIQEATNYKVDKISISIYEDEFRYGDIKDIELVINEIENKESNGNQTSDIIAIANVEKITIGKGEENPRVMEEFDKDKEIKNVISKNYNVPKENIKIFLNTTGEGE